MLRLDLVRHIETYPPSSLDATTLRNLARMLDDSVKDHDRISAECGDGQSEFDEVFAEDRAACVIAYDIIVAELQSRGLEP